MKLRVLLFEDDFTVCSILTSMLRRRGYEVISYDHPQKCEILSSPECACEPPYQCADILIFDRYYFGEDCLDSMKKQKERGCKAKFFAVMSASLGTEDQEWADANCVKLLPKPFVIDKLPDWLDECEAGVPEDRLLIDLEAE